MFKFLRKYNKLLLAIFGVLLMITFLIPQAIENLGRQAGAGRATVATLGDGERVSSQQWNQAQQELQFLQRIAPMLQFVARLQVLSAADRMAPEHWLLLVREAEQAGLISTGAALPISDEMLVQMAAAGQTRDANFIRETLAKLFGVEQMISLYQSSGIYSDRRLKNAAEQMLHQVVVQSAVIEAQPAEDVQPSEDEIQAQFQKYADAAPGAGQPFGYRLPDRVKIEWIQISEESVREAARRSEKFSSVAQRLHWRAHENDPDRGFPPRTQGAEIPDVVREDLLNELTREMLDEVSRFASDQLRLNRRGLPEREGYVVLPENWGQRKLSFTQLAAEIQSRYGIELPTYRSTGEWVAATDLDELEGIGEASTDRLGAVPVSFSQLVQATRELQRGEYRSMFMQQDVAGPPLRGPEGDVYVFRVIDADPARAPHSVDEVREQVVNDLRRVAAYERLLAQKGAIEQQAQVDGLLNTAVAHGTTVQQTTTVSLANRFMLQQMAQAGMPVGVSPSPLPGLGTHRATVEAIIDHARSLPRDVPVSNLPEEQRVNVVPVPDRHALVVVRLMQQNPLTQEEYANLVQLGVVQQLVVDRDARDSNPLEEAFSLDAMTRRHNFAFTRTGTEDPLAALPRGVADRG